MTRGRAAAEARRHGVRAAKRTRAVWARRSGSKRRLAACEDMLMVSTMFGYTLFREESAV
jgi:hypothetical protein